MPSGGMPWVKLYTEFLDDPKVGFLDELAQLLLVKLFLLAGECDAEGYLANGDELLTKEHIAWRLRIPAQEFLQRWAMLEDKGFVDEEEDGALCIVKFQERQGRSQSEKRKQWRERKARQRENEAGQPEDSDECHAGITRESDENHAPRVEESREEKSREEKSREEPTGADAPDPPPKKPKKPSKTRPKSIEAFRANAHRFPAKSWWPKIHEAVGEEEADLERWGQVVFAWVGMGWSAINVKGMLEFFERNEIPGDGQGHNLTTAQMAAQVAREFEAEEDDYG